MANPTGTVFLQANPSYVWADGDVYEIVQTDEVEGAATGASFGGIGVDNQPHQLLLDKANYIHTKLLADEATLASLQSLTQLITSDVGINGWLKLGTEDVNRGEIALIFQWGFISFAPYANERSLLPPNLTFSFPISFPNAVWILMPYWQDSSTTLAANPLPIAVSSPLQLAQNNILIDNAGIEQLIATNTAPGLTGVGWVALGY